MESHPVVSEWLHNVEHTSIAADRDRPNYWRTHPVSLLTATNVHGFTFGTGFSVYTNSILPAIETAEEEVVLVTCFWAPSPILDALNNTLRNLSAKGVRTGRKIRVRICFSSSSLFQKLLHSASLDGRTYSAGECHRKLSLPQQDEIYGLDLEVKSIFVLPFSVMHPKFIIIDRKQVLLPSCNVSWEDWYEGCLELRGRVTEQFAKFWLSFWASERDRAFTYGDNVSGNKAMKTTQAQRNPKLLHAQRHRLEEMPSIFLPSPHHRNPQFALPWRSCLPPPATPLNTFLLSTFVNAKNEIYIQTPNLTSPPVLSALLAALRRGVDVTILTSERLMILEQLATAGTTTRRCIKKLNKRHKALVQKWRNRDPDVVEAGLAREPGDLQITFYQADPKATEGQSEPVQSHTKLTIVDSEWMIFGSGNMDRASWYTSQELCVAFFSSDFVSELRNAIDSSMRRRSRRVFVAGLGSELR